MTDKLTLPHITGQGEVTGMPTEMAASAGTPWEVPADRFYGENGEVTGHKTRATLRRIGWLDQKGRVWTRTPQTTGFDGGSLTPLLIDARET